MRAGAKLRENGSTMSVNLSELQNAVEFVSGREIGEQQAWVCAHTGKIYWHFDPKISGEVDEDLPEDIDDKEKYLAVPNKRELDLGTPLVLNFVRKVLPADFDEVRDMFGRRGAYGRFKQLLTKRRAAQQWHDFENAETERALREWCELNSIAVAD
jgi:hypothetical protein